MRAVFALVVACLCVVLVYQNAQIRQLKFEIGTQAARSESAHRQLLTLKCPTCECSKWATNEQLITSRKEYAGVAVTTFLGAPKWFQNRYSLMVNQVLAMVEDDWVVQIVYDPAVKMALEGIAYPGIKRQIKRGRVILTPIPKAMKKIKKNKLLLSPWFWKSLLAENVLLFGGTAAVCANTEFEVSNFTHFDYIGAPWNPFQGMGGEGGITMRKRSLMEKLAIEYAETHTELGKSIGTTREDSIVVKALVERKAGHLASREVSWLLHFCDNIFVLRGGAATSFAPCTSSLVRR